MSFSVFEKNIITKLLGKDLIGISQSFGNIFLYTRASSIVRVITILYTNNELSFNTLIDAFAVDMLKHKNKFEVYYHIYSRILKEHLFIVVDIERNEYIPSLSIVFKNIAWYEREMFDMFGIMFAGHQDIRRILNKHDAIGFELRKDN